MTIREEAEVVLMASEALNTWRLTLAIVRACPREELMQSLDADAESIRAAEIHLATIDLRTASEPVRKLSRALAETINEVKQAILDKVGGEEPGDELTRGKA